MANVSIIYDGSISTGAINLTNTFSYGKFVYFTCSSLETDEVAEIGVSCIAQLPSLNGTVEKLWVELGTCFTDTVITLPSEITDSGNSFLLAFSSDVSLSGFRTYLISSDVTLESLQSQIEALELTVNSQNTVNQAIAANQFLQNQALAIIAVGLTPISAGVTAPVVPLLEASPLPFLLPP